MSATTLKMKTTSIGRQPQNKRSRKSQKPLIGSSSNLKLKLRGPYQNQIFLKWRWHPLKDGLKILKDEYLGNHWSDPPQSLNPDIGDPIQIEDSWNEDMLYKGRLPQNTKYICNHWSDLPQIFNFNLGYHTKIIKKILKWRRHPMKDDLKI